MSEVELPNIEELEEVKSKRFNRRWDRPTPLLTRRPAPSAPALLARSLSGTIFSGTLL